MSFRYTLGFLIQPDSFVVLIFEEVQDSFIRKFERPERTTSNVGAVSMVKRRLLVIDDAPDNLEALLAAITSAVSKSPLITTTMS